MSTRILTTIDASSLADIVRAAQGNKSVARLIDDVLFTGEARSIGTETGTLATRNDDVRDLFLRVTLPGAVDAFWRVSDLMAECSSGTFVIDYRAA